MQYRPINSVKHVVDQQNVTVVNTTASLNVIDTVDNPVLGNNSNVATASVVKAIYLVVEAYATSGGALSNFYLTVQKLPGNNIAVITPNVVGVSDDKKWVIHQEMKMLQQVANGNPRTIFQGVIRIPKRYQRMGYDDALSVNVLTPGITANYCIQCIYKEFR